MITLQNLILVSLLPILLFWGSEENTLKEARIDVSIGYYHLATVRLERILKEYPKSRHRREMLQLIIKSYVQSEREQEAIPHIRTFFKEFPNEAATLDPKLLNLVSSLPQIQAVESVPKTTALSAPPEAVIEMPPPSSVLAKEAQSGEAPPAAGITVPPVKELTPSVVTSTQQAQPKVKIEKTAPPDAAPATAVPVSEQKAEAPSAQEVPPSTVIPSAEKERMEYYTLSAGETVDSRVLSRLLKKLRATALQPIVSEGKRSVVMHRLVAGCYSTNIAALKRKRELAGVSKDAFIFREGDSFCVAAGSFKLEKSVKHELKRLAVNGIVTRIVPTSVNLPFWSITAGRFPDVATAEMAQQRLSADGFKLAIQPIKNDRISRAENHFIPVHQQL